MKELKDSKRAFVQADNLDDTPAESKESEAEPEEKKETEEPKKRGKKKK